MKHTIIYAILVSLIVMMGCAPSNSVSESDGSWNPTYSMQVGISHGGIIENTDLKQIPNTDVDAFSGATSISPTVSAHIQFPVLKNEVETGVEYMFTKQTFTYNDNVNGFIGERELTTSQLIFPLTYNFKILRKIRPNDVWSFKFGFVGEYNLVNINDNNSTLPAYTLNNFSGGFVIGANALPFSFENGSKLGFFFDMYRGSRIYTDFYNQKNFEMPGSSFGKFGLLYRFN